MKTVNFFLSSLSITLSERMAYKANFIIRVITLMTFDLMLPLVTILVYLRSRGFPGWSFHEIVLFQGMFLFINAFDRFFFQRVDWNLSHDVRSGKFDRYLLYPVNTLTYISFNNLGVEHIVNVIVGIAALAYAWVNLQIALTAGNIALLLYFVFLALVFITSMAMFRFALIIRYVNIGRLGELYRTIKSFGEYPVSIFGTILSSVFRFLVPLAILAYFPASVLLEKTLGNTLLPAITVLIIAFLSFLFWRYTIRHYTSAGG